MRGALLSGTGLATDTTRHRAARPSASRGDVARLSGARGDERPGMMLDQSVRPRGGTVADITGPGTMAVREGMWRAVLDTGMRRGVYSVIGPTGKTPVTFGARAHHPAPGFFSSRAATLGRD